MNLIIPTLLSRLDRLAAGQASSVQEFAFFLFMIPALAFLCWALLQLHLDLKRAHARHHHWPKSTSHGLPHLVPQPALPNEELKPENPHIAA